MEKVLKIILVVYISIITLSACTTNFKCYENNLYSEKDLNGYDKSSTQRNSKAVTKQEAVKKAICIFDKVFNIKIDRKKLSENIILINDNNHTNFCWDITWTNDSNNDSFICTIDSNDGTIKYISCSSRVQSSNISENLINIVAPLFNEININIDDYRNISTASFGATDCYYFENIKNPKKGFRIGIDHQKRTICYFAEMDIEKWRKNG
ncbi:hypothetical protein HBE96_08730 [Clostridium sp. P21]|uniref:Uncharacterized protein n=1 Tax=Clostridium muellerianum TaxID=2716538 RepID=A0A7Y0EG20_9CLOT|nr:hypothetical protein [Clostridium muellerianum]NMM62780.1 hypothetical protein [Clostridium muellerianum]